jgi:hypothetical protein
VAEEPAKRKRGRPSRRPVRLVVYISREADDWIEARRGPIDKGEYVRGLLRLGKARVEAGVTIPRDTT